MGNSTLTTALFCFAIWSYLRIISNTQGDSPVLEMLDTMGIVFHPCSPVDVVCATLGTGLDNRGTISKEWTDGADEDFCLLRKSDERVLIELCNLDACCRVSR